MLCRFIRNVALTCLTSDFNVMLRLRRFLDSLSDEKMDEMLRVCGKLGVDKALSDVDEIDFQGKLMLKVLGKTFDAGGYGLLCLCFICLQTLKILVAKHRGGKKKMGEFEYKQVLVFRTDLQMGKGKIAAQAGHAAVSAAQDAFVQHKKWWEAWLYEGQRKIAVKVAN